MLHAIAIPFLLESPIMESKITPLTSDVRPVPSGGSSAILPNEQACSVQIAKVVNDDAERLLHVPIASIDCPDQPRKQFDLDLIRRMGASIESNGLFAAILVSRSEVPGRFVLEDGEQRLRAQEERGATTILARVIEAGGEDRRLIRHLQSNSLRAPLLPGEEALALSRLQEILGLNNKELAHKVQMTVTHVSRRLSLLKFSPEHLGRIDAGGVSEIVAVEIAKVPNADDRVTLLDRALADGNWTKERAVAAVSAVKKRRQTRRAVSKAPIRATFELGERGGTITIVAPAHFDELSAENALFAAEFLVKGLKKAVKEKVPADKLAAFFQKAKPKTTVVAVPVNGAGQGESASPTNGHDH
jgi:ParB/RepB/Spo0J family partition protein